MTKRYHAKTITPTCHVIEDTHTLGRQVGTYCVVATCTSKAVAEHIARLLNDEESGRA